MSRLRIGRIRRLGGRGLLILIGCLAGIGIAGGMAFATIPDESGVVHLCYTDNGALRVIDTGAPKPTDRTCKNSEQALEIDQHGTPGASGPSGPAGASGTAGAPGANGATGPQGPSGPSGSQGPSGATGAPGATGATGSQGASGPSGPPGAAGASGPSGPASTVSVGTRRGPTNPPTTTLAFLSPALTVTIASGQVVLVSAQVTLGSTAAGGATFLRLWICDQPSGGSIAAPHPIDWITAIVLQGSLDVYPITDTITGLAPGTYTVGLCGQLTAATTNWNEQDWAYTTAQVINGAAALSSPTATATETAGRGE